MRKKFFDVLMALVMTLSIGIVCLAGCGEGEESSETPSDSYTVTFDVNYEGGTRGNERLVYSNDGLIYYSPDKFTTFEEVYGE